MIESWYSNNCLIFYVLLIKILILPFSFHSFLHPAIHLLTKEKGTQFIILNKLLTEVPSSRERAQGNKRLQVVNLVPLFKKPILFLESATPVFNVSAPTSPEPSPQLSVKFRKAPPKVRRGDAFYSPEQPDGLVSVSLNDSSMEMKATSKSLYHVTGMSCSSCVAKIEREISKKPGKLIIILVGSWVKGHCCGCPKR